VPASRAPSFGTARLELESECEVTILGMKSRCPIALLLFPCVLALAALAQTSPDDRFKADILLVVAHPDDDTAVSSYLSRAVFDQHKRVGVVYCTR